MRLARPPARWNRPAGFVPQLCPPPPNRLSDIQLLRRTGADAVVVRATGCDADALLLAAARSLDLPVVMIRRPPDQGEVVRSVEAVLDWLAATVAGFRSATAAVPAWR